MISEYLAILGISLIGSVHCIGMCGGLALALGTCDQPIGPVLRRQLIYTLGRICTYAFLGALAGAVGVSLADVTLPWIHVTAPQVLSVLAGIIMVIVGIRVLGFWPHRRYAISGGTQGGPGLLAPAFKHFMNAKTPWGFFTAGLATGFLPCGFVYAFVPKAIESSDVLSGMLIMVMFGLGTAPAMVGVGCGSRFLSHAARGRVFQVAACLLIIMGAMTIRRGWPTRTKPCCEHQSSVPLSIPAEAQEANVLGLRFFDCELSDA